MGCLCVEDELFTEEEIIQGEFFPGKNKKSNQNTQNSTTNNTSNINNNNYSNVNYPQNYNNSIMKPEININQKNDLDNFPMDRMNGSKLTSINIYPIEKEIRIEALNDGLLIWINENYNNLENSSYLRLLKKNKNLTIKCFENVNDAFNFLFQKKNINNKDIIGKINFRAIFVLISGRLYPDYYEKLKERINEIIFLPICCIFTSFRLSKEIGINKSIYKEIESPFFNKEGVKFNFADCIKSFEKYNLFYKKFSKFISYKKLNRSYEGCLTFELIFTKNQLVFPFLFNEIMENEKNIIPDNDIIAFTSFVQKNFNEKEIQKLIIPMLYMKYYPREIVSKFFTRI